jgi:hypothetical protein
MNKNYDIELTEANLKKYANKLEKVEKALKGEEFRKFILSKAKTTLQEIMESNDISTDDENAGDYVNGNKTEIGKDYVYLFNDSVIDVKSLNTFFNEDTKANYPDTLSLAALIEYGTGLEGYQSSKNTGKEWEYMANPNRDYSKGWVWKGANGQPIRTLGKEGKYIYYELSEKVEEQLDEWVKEYLEEVIGGII